MKKYNTYSKGEGYPTIEVIGDGILRIDPEEFFRSPVIRKKIEALRKMRLEEKERANLSKCPECGRERQPSTEEEKPEK